MNKKRSCCVLTAIILSSLCSYAMAQGGMIGIHAGYLNPKDTKGGMYFGGAWGTSIDESVDLGIGFDLFHKTYTDEAKVATENANGITTNLIETELEYGRTILPIMLQINVKIPTGRYFGYLIRAGIGYEFLFSKEKNYVLNTNQTRNYRGLGWQAAGGIYYHIGSRSTFTADAIYNSFEVSRNVEKSTKGLPVTERVDLSGLGFRIGVLLELR